MGPMANSRGGHRIVGATIDSQFHILFLIEIENHQRREQQR